MKKTIGISILAVMTTFFFALFVHAALENGAIKLAPGDEVYACGCGESCACKTISRSSGQCTCGKDLVKARVVKAEEGMAVLEINGKEETFPTVGKYACACGPACNCDTISQSPGKCACGNPLEPVK